MAGLETIASLRLRMRRMLEQCIVGDSLLDHEAWRERVAVVCGNWAQDWWSFSSKVGALMGLYRLCWQISKKFPQNLLKSCSKDARKLEKLSLNFKRIWSLMVFFMGVDKRQKVLKIAPKKNFAQTLPRTICRSLDTKQECVELTRLPFLAQFFLVYLKKCFSPQDLRFTMLRQAFQI